LSRMIRLSRSYTTEGPGPAALYFHPAGTLHPVKLAAELCERIVTKGGAIFEDARVNRIESNRGQAILQMDGGGQVSADTVVIATAGYTSRLGFFCGRILPVHLQLVAPEPLSREMLAQLGWNERQPILDSRRLFNYFRLTADNRIVFGGGMPR